MITELLSTTTAKSRTSDIKKYMDVFVLITYDYVSKKSSSVYYTEIYRLEEVLKDDIQYLLSINQFHTAELLLKKLIKISYNKSNIMNILEDEKCLEIFLKEMS